MKVEELNQKTPEELQQLKQKLDEISAASPELAFLLMERRILTEALQALIVEMWGNEKMFAALVGQVPRDPWQILSDFAEMEKKHEVLKKNG